MRRHAACASEARGRVADELPSSLSDEVRENVLLVTSELVTNAYLHGAGKIELSMRFAGDHVVIEVIDGGRPGRVGIRDPHAGPGGWGLRIVDSLATEWGVFEGTTHVWAKLPLR